MISYPPYDSLLAQLPVRGSTVTVLGSSTRFWDYGPPDAAVTIVITHGFRGDHHGLEPVIGHVGGVRVIAPDLPGFGESSPLTETDHSIEGYASWLVGFVDALGLPQRPVILGHSFGSIITSRAVADGLVTPRLILINPIADSALKGPKAILTWLTVLFYRVSAALPRRAGRRLLASWLVVRMMSVLMAKTSNRDLRAWIHDQHHAYFSRFSDTKTLLEAFGASITGSVGSVAPQIAVPTLLIGADQDPITRVSAMHELAADIPVATLRMMTGVGHLIHYERPQEAAREIVSFLGSGRVLGPPP